ncbi:hypothetical protein F5876DRAFT_84044 [Lentinula aff. lateritia]|uniref:Uncharacterized protein n=1 Tax=Lentinula aff. lateritia TaxID=2804960 RepID=A0ACC1THE0_9AGAR|nr:hypothetical protein F5876DRAFT_84044 [Lentinula aff. lateritia]
MGLPIRFGVFWRVQDPEFEGDRVVLTPEEQLTFTLNHDHANSAYLSWLTRRKAKAAVKIMTKTQAEQKRKEAEKRRSAAERRRSVARVHHICPTPKPPGLISLVSKLY